jgi:hypothetical protein
MSPNPNAANRRNGLIALGIVVSALALIPVLLLLGVLSFFHLSSETAALRASALESLPGAWNSKVAVHAGYFTTAAVRLGARFFKLPPEAQAGIASLRGIEVGVYKSQGTESWVDMGTVLARADKAMSARRWDRAVGVSREGELVAVYVPRTGFTSARVRCCVLVLHGGDLVVAGVSGNIDPVLEIARQRLDWSRDLGAQFNGFNPHHKLARPEKRHARAAKPIVAPADL